MRDAESLGTLSLAACSEAFGIKPGADQAALAAFSRPRWWRRFGRALLAPGGIPLGVALTMLGVWIVSGGIAGYCGERAPRTPRGSPVSSGTKTLVS